MVTIKLRYCISLRVEDARLGFVSLLLNLNRPDATLWWGNGLWDILSDRASFGPLGTTNTGRGVSFRATSTWQDDSLPLLLACGPFQMARGERSIIGVNAENSLTSPGSF